MDRIDLYRLTPTTPISRKTTRHRRRQPTTSSASFFLLISFAFNNDCAVRIKLRISYEGPQQEQGRHQTLPCQPHHFIIPTAEYAVNYSSRASWRSVRAAPGVVVCYTEDAGIRTGKKFVEAGVQIAAGVPLKCDEPEDFPTFRIGVFGLDKLQNVDRTVKTLEEALERMG